MSIRKTVALVAVALLSPIVLHASTLIDYPDFSSTTGLTLVGSPSAPTTLTTVDGTVLRLVTNTSGQSGAAYSTTGITLGSANSFSTQFDFRITDAGGIDPADGITFVLAANTTGLGGAGGGLGYQGVGNSLAIEFDTYQNGEFGDPNDNHVGVDEDGNLQSLITNTPYGVNNCSLGVNTTNGCLSDGDLWTALITYDGTNLNVWVTDDANGDATEQLITNYAVNLQSVLGTNTAFAGFTGATGSGVENEDIKDWEFSNTATLPPPPTGLTPEPGTLLMVGTGLVGALTQMRRRFIR